MADQEYNLRYTSDNSDILAKTNVVIRALRLLDQIADRLLPKLKALFSGAGSAAGSAAGKFDRAAAALKAVDAEAVKVKASLGSLGPVATSAGDGTAKLGLSLGSLGVGLAMAHQLVRVFKELGAAINEARDFSRELGQESAQTLEKAREISFLRGEKGPKPKVAADVLSMAVDTGSSDAEMTQYLESFEGAIPAARARGNVSASVERGLALEGATFANRTGLDPETGGKLAGLLGEYSRIESVEQGAGQIGMIGDQLNLGVGKLQQLAKPFLGLAGSMVDETGGRVQDLPQLAAIYGTMTTRAKSPSVAATQIKQVNRLVTKESDDNRALRDAAGITDEDDYVTSVRKIAPLVAGPGGDKLLKEAGYANSTERDSTIAAARSVAVALERVESVGHGKTKDERRKLQEKAGAATIADNRDFLSRDETGRVARAKLAAARFAKGMETKDLETRRTEAMAELITEDQIKSPEAAVWDKINGGFGFKEAFGGKPQELARIDARVAENLIRKAEKHGIRARSKYPALVSAADGHAGTDEKQFGLSVRQLREEILSKGGRFSADSPGVPQALGRAGADAATANDSTLFPVVGTRRTVRADHSFPPADRFPRPGGAQFMNSMGDPRAIQVQLDQLRELQKLNAKVGGGPKPAVGAKPLPVDVDDAGSTR